MPNECGILFTDFACAYPSVHHRWIFRVLQKSELSQLPTVFFLPRICNESTTAVEHAGEVRSHFAMAGRLLPVHHGLHRWAAPRKKFTNVCAELTSSPKRFVDRLVARITYASPVLGYVGSLAAPDQASLTDESRASTAIVCQTVRRHLHQSGPRDRRMRDSRRQPCCKIPFCISLEHTFIRTGEHEAARCSLLTTLHAASAHSNRTFLRRSMAFRYDVREQSCAQDGSVGAPAAPPAS